MSGVARRAPASAVKIVRESAAFQVEEQFDDALGIDVRAIWATIYRHRYWLLGLFLAAALAALVVTMLTEPKYRAAATVQIEQQALQVLDVQGVEPIAAGQDPERFLQTQLDVLRSRSLASRVADDLRLHESYGLFSRLVAGIDESEFAALSPEQRRRRVVGTLIGGMDATLPKNSRVARIMFTSADPELAARIANSYAENYIVSNLERKFSASSYARDFLENQLRAAKIRLEESERSMIAYARAAGLVETGAGTEEAEPSRSLTTSNLVQLNADYAEARSRRIEAQQRWEQAQRRTSALPTQAAESPAIQALLESRAQAMAAYQQERARRKEEHPAVVQLAAQVGELDRQIAQLVEQVRNGIRDEYRLALQQEQALLGNVAQLKGEALREQDRSVQYNILRREADTNRSQYDALLQRYRQLTTAAGATDNNISIVDLAEPPGAPVSPNLWVNLVLALMAALAVAVVLIFTRERLQDAVRSPEDVEQKLGLPVLGVAPALPKGEDPSAALLDARSTLSEAYNSVRTALEYATATGTPHTLVITSSQSGEGKSTTAFALAQKFAVTGSKVLLIDADLRRPSQHRQFSLPNQEGLSGILTGRADLDKVTQATGVEGLDLLTSGKLPPNPAEILAGPAFSQMLSQASGKYALVVVDAPPILGLADAAYLSGLVDGVVFVVEANRAHGGQAKLALKRLRASGAKLFGAVLTKYNARETGYGYDYGYSYNYRHTSGDG